jgi:hypothetical protein
LERVSFRSGVREEGDRRGERRGAYTKGELPDLWNGISQELERDSEGDFAVFEKRVCQEELADRESLYARPEEQIAKRLVNTGMAERDGKEKKNKGRAHGKTRNEQVRSRLGSCRLLLLTTLLVLE